MFTLPQLPYAFNALEPYIDEATMKLHHGKHHQAYIDNLNVALNGQDKLLELSIEEIVANLAKVPENIRTKVKNHGGGHANHTLFWQIMGPPSGTEPEGAFMSAINDTFGSFMSMQEAVTQKAMGRFGSGWAWIVVSRGKLEVMDTLNQDNPLMEHKIPLLGVDVWEHAYYLKYQNRRVEYLKAWWNVVNWSAVDLRFQEALRSLSEG
ncbi:MAG: superoxide dismutase [Patescibacteria group bacterium]